jgi:dTDP-glucose pyrophosphorylase
MKEDKRLKNRIITPDETIIHSLKLMDSLAVKSLLIINDKEIFNGVLSIGDIQRAIIKNVNLEQPVKVISRQNPKFALRGTELEDIKAEMMKYRMEFMPVIDDLNKLIDIFFWEDLFPIGAKIPTATFDVPVVIMAGGLGSRLRPFTNVLPKPLFPVGEHTIMEEIFNVFYKFGCTRFFISINYKADLIEFYLNSIDHPYKLDFIRENTPLGTAGSLWLLKNKIKETFFISNCDILIEQDYSEILDYHREYKNEITLVAALKQYPIPYGIIETGQGGLLIDIKEKPEMTFKINSGMYILEPSLLQEVPDNQFFHITELIEKVKKRKGNIGVFPVSEKSWKDFGEWGSEAFDFWNKR